jgi:protein TonB
MSAYVLNKWTRGFSFSLIVHLAAFGGLLGFIQWQEQVNPVTVDLDLTQAPRLPRFAQPRGHSAPPPKDWIASKAGMAPGPSSLTESAQEEAVPCPPPCPETPGDFLPSGMVSREPRAKGILLSDDDYPRQARKRNQAGKVVLEVFIDSQGAVREVRLREGQIPELNEVALSKLKQARFEPALDAAGRPVACRLILPIRFELE